MENSESRQIELTKSEQEILQGSSGSVLQKVMETVVRYGEALNAPRLVEITGPGHLVIPWAIPGICPPPGAAGGVGGSWTENHLSVYAGSPSTT